MSDVIEITAKMRLSIRPNTEVELDVIERVDPPDGWDFVITEEQSLALALGVWQLDAKLTVGAGIIVTDPVSINVTLASSTP